MDHLGSFRIGDIWHRGGSTGRRTLAVLLMAALCVAALPLVSGGSYVKAETVAATGVISSDGVNLRKSASTSSKKLGKLGKGTEVSISCEVFTAKKSASAKNRWYKVSAGGKTGFVRSDLVGSIGFSSLSAVTTDSINYRKGPAKTFKKLGSVGSGTAVTLQLAAKKKGSKETWYRAEVNGTTAYICGKYVNITGSAAAPAAAAEATNLDGKSDLARALLTDPTDGGSERVVYTFSKSNCTRRFMVKGYKNNYVPQGMAYTGSEYYILFGMSNKQGIVTYTSGGRRVRTSKFPFNMGHPNGITWDPSTGLCYIFKGNQKRIYTWNPVTNSFGKASTPFSSSGIAYDSSSNRLYASSQTGIRVYSADGAFRHENLFAKCRHSGTHYIQDCGAGYGFVFHGVSGSNKFSANYLDVYRVSDAKYLGSIKVTLGEIESAVVSDDGYVELLINHSGTYNDYIWRTPLNVKELL